MNRAALIALAALLVYWNSLSAPFIFDDHVAIVGNSTLRSPSDAFSQPRDTPLAGRPVVALTFALNYGFSDLNVRTYRTTNVAIHLFCALLMFGIVRRTLLLPRLRLRFGPSAADVACAAAVLWVVHPLTTDAVTYVTQRTESLMAMWYLVTLYASLRAHASPSRMGWQALAICACALGMASKESMVTAPIMVVLFDRVFTANSFRDALRTRWRLYAGLALTWGVLATLMASGPRAQSVGFSTRTDAWIYLLNQARLIARYLRLVLWPSDLVINYGPPANYTMSDVLPYAVIVVAVLVATSLSFRHYPELAFAGAWFFITLAPSSSFVPISTEVGAERRMYLPLMGIIVALVTVAYRLASTRAPAARKMLAAAAGVTAIALGSATAARNREHASWLTLAQTTLARWPTDVAHGGVGSELARLGRDEEALPHLQIAARTDARSRYNLGVTLYNLGRFDEAIRELAELVRRHPMREEAPWSHRVMGQAHARQGNWPAAIANLKTTLAMTPHDVEARRLLIDSYGAYGTELAMQGRFEEAIAEFRRGLQLDENRATLRYNLAVALFDKRDVDGAMAEAQRALALDRANADTYNLVGRLLATQGNLKEALDNLEAAVKLRPDDPALREDLERVRQFLK